MTIFEKNKDNIKRLENSKFGISRLIFKVLRSGYLVLKLITISSFRNQTFSRIRFKKHFHQTSHYTEINRYPDLFEICRDHFKHKPDIRILSFGCSTGEEVFSIGKYLPDARITGTDISKWCIRECRKKNKNKNLDFVHCRSEKFNKLNNLDAIFCLAVFQHPDNRLMSTGSASEYLFSQFENQIIILDKKLKTGGLLFIDNCDFNFFETVVSEHYSPLEHDLNRILRERPLFDRANKKILGITYTYRVFMKNS